MKRQSFMDVSDLMSGCFCSLFRPDNPTRSLSPLVFKSAVIVVDHSEESRMSLSLFCKLTTKTIPNSNTHIAQHSRSCRCSKATRNRRWQLGHCSRLTQRRRSSKSEPKRKKTLHDQRFVSTIQMRWESRSAKVGMEKTHRLHP
jgi:hypothetical protein